MKLTHFNINMLQRRGKFYTKDRSNVEKFASQQKNLNGSENALSLAELNSEQ